MLIGLSIRDVVLIDRLDLPFESGLCVLTGETGAGKSILLDSLNFVIGARADSSLVRKGAEHLQISAEFDIPADHPARDVLREQGLLDDNDDGGLILRRVLGAGGRSRAFVNDQPVSAGLLRKLGGCLIEIHGQHGELGLLDQANHRPLLDNFGALEGELKRCRAAFGAFKQASEALEAARAGLRKAKVDEDYLRHVMAELDDLDPRAGEEAELAEQRLLGMHGAAITAEIEATLARFGGEDGIESRLRASARGLERVADKAAGKLGPALDAVERAAIEAGEAAETLGRARADFEHDPRRIDDIEERLFALRAAARKHRCQVDDLAAVHERMAAELEAMEAGESHCRDLETAASSARKAYGKAVERLGAARIKAARRLDAAVMKELAPLKLERAIFSTRVETLEPDRWGPDGADRVVFEATTVPGADPGAIGRIASGGELSRFMLAIKVAVARRGPSPTLIFDEVDRGLGGAVADAVGERLARLSRDGQIVVVTHSPQVAARAAAHWRVVRSGKSKSKLERTTVIRLDEEARREEIARMLAGARVTDQARAAAAVLIAG